MPSNFSGSFTHKVEANGRVSIPASYRKDLEAQDSTHVVVLPRFHDPNSHVVLSQAAHRDLVARVEAQAKSLDARDRRLMKRLVTSLAHSLPIDEAGRIKLNDELRDGLGITNEVVFAGDGSVIELWHPDKWAVVRVEDAERGFELAATIDLGQIG